MNQLLNIEEVLCEYKGRFKERAKQQYSYLFPMSYNKKLAGIVADLMGDGHLQKNKWRFDYCSKDDFELERFNKIIGELFFVKGKIRKCTTNKYNTKNLGINNKLISIVMYKIGVPRGQKVLQEFLIPKWIEENREYFREFCNRLFSCEGTVDINLKNPAIAINMNKEETKLENGYKFFNQIKDGLKKYFRIRTTQPFTTKTKNVRKDGKVTYPIFLKIKGENILKFYKEIKMDDIKKQEKIKFICEAKYLRKNLILHSYMEP